MAGRGETVGVALRQIDDDLSDRGGGRIARLDVSATSEPGDGCGNLRALSYCVSHLPRFDCRVTAQVTVEYDDLDGSMSAELGGSVTAWRRVEEALLSLADRGSDLDATLTLEFTPASPIPYGGPEWDQFRSAVTNNDPGALEIVVTLADEGNDL